MMPLSLIGAIGVSLLLSGRFTSCYPSAIRRTCSLTFALLDSERIVKGPGSRATVSERMILRFWRARAGRDHNLTPSEETRIERACPRPQQSDCSSHDDYFERRQLAVK